MKRATRFWLASLVCKVVGHDERTVVTRFANDGDGWYKLHAGYVWCARCDTTVRTWGE